MQRVALKPEDHRGGLLTQASILEPDLRRHAASAGASRQVGAGVDLSATRRRPRRRTCGDIKPTPPNQPKTSLRAKIEAHRERRQLRGLPSQDRPAGPGLRQLRRDRPLADRGGRPRRRGRQPEARPQRRTARRPQVRRRRRVEAADGRRPRQVRRRVRREAGHLRAAARHDLRRPQVARRRSPTQARPTDYKLATLVESLVLSDLFQKR